MQQMISSLGRDGAEAANLLDNPVAQITAAGTLIGTWMDYMPKVAAMFAAIYYALVISKMLYSFFIKDKKNG